jgi:hypothetical protein
MIAGIIMVSMMPMIAYALAAEPPSLVILVKDPPKDLSVVLVVDDVQTEATVRKVAWEGYYAFYSRDMQKESDYVFKITVGEESFELAPASSLKGYDNVYTLDVDAQTFTPGKYPLRAVLLVLIRLLITLLIEGFIFVLFGFKEKRSWITFFVVNIITQGALNIWLNVEGSLMPSYLFITLVIGEILVFAVELVAFPLLIKEHKNSRIFIYVFVANLVSLIAGGYLISFLPV